MAWLVLVISAVFEAVWATALGRSEGFTELWPTVVFLVALTLSMLGLGWATKSISIGTAYAVWTGVGAALTVAWAMLTGTEAASLPKLVFIGGIIAAVIGLKLVSTAEEAPPPVKPAPGRRPWPPSHGRAPGPRRG
ncbi:multidrug efflux SMR transporter [Tessaracoccus sp. OS52]|uniref:DMT family transporter n=1 Tax=Tessaracoccus sp. OS52 TaxID=2886691 RepID=UPI001D12C302|nr:multidrug efflux SMR transporter [Tessaracoccus sp. OS52]